MKKFSWIFALILALSMAFVFTGCPGPDEDTPPPPDSGTKPVVPPNPANIVVTFGEGSGKTEVLPGNNGTIEYTSAGGYTYTYGTVNDSNYGNGIVRFKVDLGDKTLDDYGKVSFKWSTEGYKNDGDNASSNKKLYLLASVSGSALEPYKSDAEIKELVVSTDIFDTAPSTAFYSGDSPAPLVNGNDEQLVELPIVAEKVADLIGEVWFSIYLHAGKGKYTVSDVVFVAGPYVEGETTNPGTDAPDVPVAQGNINAWFYLDLSKITTVGSTSVAGGTVGDSNKSYDGGVLTATFGTTDGERLVVDLTDDQLAALNARTGDGLNVYVKGRVTTGDGVNFRYHIGDATAGSNWAVWGASGPDVFGKILNKPDMGYPNQGAEPKHFILQHRTTEGSATSSTIEITSIRIEFASATPEELTASSSDKGYAALVFDNTTNPVTGQNATVTYVDGGFKVVQTEGYDWSYVYFKVTFPTGYKLSDYRYIDVKTTVFSGSTGDDVGGYKPLMVAAYENVSDMPTSAAMPDSDLISKDGVNHFRGDDNTAASRTVSINRPERFEDVDGNEVWIAMRAHASAGFTYALTDIKFY